MVVISRIKRKAKHKRHYNNQEYKEISKIAISELRDRDKKYNQRNYNNGPKVQKNIRNIANSIFIMISYYYHIILLYFQYFSNIFIVVFDSINSFLGIFDIFIIGGGF